jgi:hypothetical protein
MDRRPQTRAQDLETAHLEAQLPQLWQQARVSADRQAEAQASDFKVLQPVLVGQASLAVVHRLASLRDFLLLDLLLRLALVELLQAPLALHLNKVAVAFLPGDQT